MKKIAALENSIPANNLKIIELYNKLRTEQIVVNLDYQRKLVWKNQHKLDFIETILKNYPFPEIYLAPGTLDPLALTLVDEIVDGQQRLTTIRNYIDGTEIFSQSKISVEKFSGLTNEQKTKFLNYEVSIRYLKNASKSQVKDIFQRINRTDYALNKVERLNAQWGESEFICFCKQIVETTFETDGVQYILLPDSRELFLEFFHGDDEDSESVFSTADSSRMLSLQYIMTLVATLDANEYFPRNDKVGIYIEAFNDEFPQAKILEEGLSEVIKFISLLEIPRQTRWYNKANLFTLVVELYKADRSTIIPEILGAKLLDLHYRATMMEVDLATKDTALTTSELEYLDFAREAVNQKAARETRGKFLRDLFEASRI